MCVDGKHGGQGNKLELEACSNLREGSWIFTWHEDIRPGNGKKRVKNNETNIYIFIKKYRNLTPELLWFLSKRTHL